MRRSSRAGTTGAISGAAGRFGLRFVIGAVFGVLFGVLTLTCPSSKLLAQASPVSDRPLTFDIPAQPLPLALEAFSAVSGYQVLLADRDSMMIMSKAVKNVSPPRSALIDLVDGSGLSVRFTSAQAAILMREIPLEESPARQNQQRYGAVLQQDVIRALCQDHVTSPGQYRMALDLWTAPSGRVDRVELLGSTGDADRDRRVLVALAALTSMQPPPGLPQPTTLLVLPKQSDHVSACDTAQRASVP